MKNNNVLEIKKLRKSFNNKGNIFNAVDNVSFDIAEGETVGLIGESGSGKTTIGRTIVRLHNSSSGRILLKGVNVSNKDISKDETKILRTNVQMIFQDPYGSLNEQKNIMYIVSEPVKILKIDDELVQNLYENYDLIQKFYGESTHFHFLDTVVELRTKINNEALSTYKVIKKELNEFKILPSETKKENIKILFDIYYNKKEKANFKIVNMMLDSQEAILKNWENVKKKLIKKDFDFPGELKRITLEEKIADILPFVDKGENFVTSTKELEDLKQLLNKYNTFLKISLLKSKKELRNLISEWKTNKIIAKQTYQLAKTKESFNINYFDYLLNCKIVKEIHLLKKYKIIFDSSIALQKIKTMINSDFEETIIGIKDANNSDEIKNAVNSVDLTLYTKQYIEKLENIDKNHNKFVYNEFVIEHELISGKTNIIKSYKTLNKKIELLSKSVENFKEEKPKESFIKEHKKLIEQLQKAKEIQAIEYKKWDDKNQEAIALKRKNSNDINDGRTKKIKMEFDTAEKLLKEKVDEVLSDESIESGFKGKKEDKLLLEWFKMNNKKYFGINKNLDNEIKRIYKDINVIRKFIINKTQAKYKVKALLVRNKVFDALEESGLSKAHAFRYPHEFSGGMRQRVGIARAIISDPKLIIADEPIAALDLSIQAQIVNMLKELQIKRKMSMLFIAHDLSMIKYISDYILIMHLGKIVEKGTRDEIFKNPIHPYTKNLIDSMPDIAKISKQFSVSTFNSEYLEKYTPLNKPEYHTIKGRHQVLADEEQIKLWTK